MSHATPVPPVQPAPLPVSGQAAAPAKPVDTSWRSSLVASWGPVLLSGATSFIGMGCLSVLHFGVMGGSNLSLVVASFGATSVLLFAAPASPFSQPRSVILGHVSSAFMGVTVQLIATRYGIPAYVAVPAAASLALMGMQLLRCVHPPAGGTALIAVTGPATLLDMGYLFCVPALVGSSFLVASAWMNNAVGRKYPN